MGSTERQQNDDDDDDAIDESAIKAYLEFVSTIPTVFDDEAFSMLKYYFIVTRAIRPSEHTDILYEITKTWCNNSGTTTIFFSRTLSYDMILQTF